MLHSSVPVPGQNTCMVWLDPMQEEAMLPQHKAWPTDKPMGMCCSPATIKHALRPATFMVHCRRASTFSLVPAVGNSVTFAA